MALALQAIICLLVCISVLINCTEYVIVDGVRVADPSAKSEEFIQVEDMIVENRGVTRNKRYAIVQEGRGYWTGGVVPYNISSTFSENEKRIILESMKQWEDYTCIRFRLRTDSDPHSVQFFEGSSCSSYGGKYLGLRIQGLSLAPGCVEHYIVLHEIGHALGFHHEHMRFDRDKYITITGTNPYDIVPASIGNTLGLGYDYASIMHAHVGDIRGKYPSINFGADELSPLDIAKTNRLYNCSARPPPPPSVISTVVAVPDGISCGSVTKVTGPGSITSPQYPRHILNEECAFVLEAPKGYRLLISFPEFKLDPSTNCAEDYVQIYTGTSVSSADLVSSYSATHFNGRFCQRNESATDFLIDDNIATIYYRTNERTIRPDVTGLRISYDLRDIDDCHYTRNTRCHTCKNLPGSFECICREGFYPSLAGRGTCFDVNECAIDNGECGDNCTNTGGSYFCSCYNGLFLQEDGLSCGQTPPSSTPQPPTPGTSIPKPLYPVAPLICGGELTDSSGVFNTPNWPSTYPFNFNCTWNIISNVPNTVIEISFDNDFGLEGNMPDCPKDQLYLFDGGNTRSQRLGVFCHLTGPNPIRTASNRLTVMFVSGSYHSPERHGFRAQYRSVPVAPPTATFQPLMCGGGFRKLASLSGSLQTFNWPNSPYAINIECDWDIECPIGNTIAIQFEDSFRVAGRMPNCTKDQLTISGCGDMNYGPYCHVTRPEAFNTTCNAVHVSFRAGSGRGRTRTGFKLNYVCIASIPLTLSPQCGGGNRSLTAPRGSIQTLNWPNDPYPINTECLWDIRCPLGAVIYFETSFKLAGRMPECIKDRLEISGCGTDYGPYCHLTRPDRIMLACQKINVLFRSASERGISRTGFKLNYRCV